MSRNQDLSVAAKYFEVFFWWVCATLPASFRRPYETLIRWSFYLVFGVCWVA